MHVVKIKILVMTNSHIITSSLIRQASKPLHTVPIPNPFIVDRQDISLLAKKNFFFLSVWQTLVPCSSAGPKTFWSKLKFFVLTKIFQARLKLCFCHIERFWSVQKWYGLDQNILVLVDGQGIILFLLDYNSSCLLCIKPNRNQK